eukprot:797326-Pyramimonas_sp.AAC.1
MLCRYLVWQRGRWRQGEDPRMRDGRILGCEDPRMRVVWAVMFFTICRKENFSVDKTGAFNPRQHLTRGDVKILQPGVQLSSRVLKPLIASGGGGATFLRIGWAWTPC